MKKAVIISAILIFGLAITSVVFAEQQIKETCALSWGNGCIIPKPVQPIPPIPPKTSYDVQMANGVAVDRYYLTTEPVLFVIFNYNWDTKMYLILGGDFNKMQQIESRYDWNTNTRMFKYRDDYGNVMTLSAQEFSDGISISAVYKNYIITFEPIRYGVVNPEPVVRETQIMPIMPVFKQLTQGMAPSMGAKAGVTAENLISQAKPIAEWSEKGK
jgi:hypothetical protein